MGRNFHSACHTCEVTLMHLRGKESDHMQRFANDHPEKHHVTKIYNDYQYEPPLEYKDVYDEYHKDS